MRTFGLSFVGRFVLFRSVLYRRFHCVPFFVQRKRYSEREYVPEYRSGPYALLIALYHAKEVSKVTVPGKHLVCLSVCLLLFV